MNSLPYNSMYPSHPFSSSNPTPLISLTTSPIRKQTLIPSLLAKPSIGLLSLTQPGKRGRTKGLSLSASSFLSSASFAFFSASCRLIYRVLRSPVARSPSTARRRNSPYLGFLVTYSVIGRFGEELAVH